MSRRRKIQKSNQKNFGLKLTFGPIFLKSKSWMRAHTHTHTHKI